MRWGVAGFAAMAGLRSVAATRYVTPLREGGSLPGLVEADDDGLYVLKFRGAGPGHQGAGGGGDRRRAGARAGPGGARDRADGGRSRARRGGARSGDPGADHGVGGRQRRRWTSCPGSLPYTPAAGFQPSAELAAEVVWLDALVSNVDRTPRNPNLLVWHERLWLIDHGAALYFHHRDWDPEVDAAKPFAGISRPRAAADRGSDPEADERLAPRRRATSCARRSTPSRRLARARSATSSTCTRRLAPRLREEAEGARAEPVPVRDRARRPAGRARRVHERRRRLLLPPAALPGGADRARRGAAGRLRPRARRRRGARAPRRDDADRRRATPAPGPVAQLEQSERFHWLVAPSSTVIQTSPVHTGLCDDPEATLARPAGEARDMREIAPGAAPLDRSAPGLRARPGAGQRRRVARAGRLHALPGARRRGVHRPAGAGRAVAGARRAGRRAAGGRPHHDPVARPLARRRAGALRRHEPPRRADAGRRRRAGRSGASRRRCTGCPGPARSCPATG